MTPITRFSLAKHTGPYEQWPSRTRLFCDSIETATDVPGYCLLHQYQLRDGYLLVTDCDCPYEEETIFVLLDAECRLIAYLPFIPFYYSSFNLDRVEWVDETNLIATFEGYAPWRITIRPWGIPYLRSRLVAKRLRT
ncbi:hypothetical protein [Chitinivorax sp. B]|uniref:hypothetical protein n=1 Tax=Chitinivorax sp. B TaxID=2502235 RepID=UPI0010F7DBA5|nr:hypothetical protein [Chitinivorax sp. B]